MARAAVLRVLYRRAATAWIPQAGWVRMTVQQPRRAFAYGDELLLAGVWSAVPPPGNPGAYDRRAALARHQIHGQLRVKSFHGIARLERHQGQPVIAWVARLRHRWEGLPRGLVGAC